MPGNGVLRENGRGRTAFGEGPDNQDIYPEITLSMPEGYAHRHVVTSR